VGLDVDPLAIEAARGNAELNGMMRRCHHSRASLGRIRSRFDVVVANVDRATLVSSAGLLGARVHARGLLLLTGFLVEDAAEIARVYRARGFRVTKRIFELDFTLLQLRRTGVPSRTRT
jgi:ribosomal protein L11 methyltransferase